MARHSRASPGWNFVLRWMAANAVGLTFGRIVGQLIGIMTGGIVAMLAGEAPGELVFVATIGAVIGLAIGLMQRVLLPQPISLFRRWLGLTCAGWALGFALATSIAPILDAAIDKTAGELMSSAVVGASVGLAQWLSLRTWLPQAGWWIPVNVASWAIGPALGGLMVDRLLANLGTAWLTHAVSGAIAGILTGIVLNRMAQPLLGKEAVERAIDPRLR